MNAVLLSIHLPIQIIWTAKNFTLLMGKVLERQTGDIKYCFQYFRNKPLRALYSALHPSIGVGIGHRWSLNSRLGKGISLDFLGEEKEDLIRYAKSVLEMIILIISFWTPASGAFIQAEQGPEIIFLGDWVRNGSYAEWDGNEIILRQVN